MVAGLKIVELIGDSPIVKVLNRINPRTLLNLNILGLLILEIAACPWVLFNTYLNALSSTSWITLNQSRQELKPSLHTSLILSENISTIH